MTWEVDIEMEVSAIKTFRVEAESRPEAIKEALWKAIGTDWSNESVRPKFHTMHVDIA